MRAEEAGTTKTGEAAHLSFVVHQGCNQSGMGFFSCHACFRADAVLAFAALY